MDSILPLSSRVALQEDSTHLIGNATQVLFAPWGEWYVADFQMREVKRFAADGRFLGVIGRAGAGPGEYNAPVDVSYARNPDRVAVTDMSRDRLIVYGGDSMKALRTREVVSKVMPKAAILGDDDDFFFLGVNKDFSAAEPREVALVGGSDSVTRYMLPRPVEHRHRGIAVNLASTLGARSAGYLYLSHQLYPMVYRADLRGQVRDSVRLPAAMLKPTELPEVRPPGLQGLQAFRRTLESLARIVVVDDSTLAITTRRYDATREGSVYRLAVLRWSAVPQLWITAECDCRVAGARGDTLAIFTGRSGEQPFLEYRLLPQELRAR
jgi:hypothetical protein